MRIAPVYIADILQEILISTVNAFVNGKTILATIIDNETAALGVQSQITQVRYSKSSFDELIETLEQQDKDRRNGGELKKYPLFHLVQDVVEDRGTAIGVYAEENLNLIFAHQTDQNFKIEDRDAKVFKPVLLPLYYEYMEQLKRSNWISGNWDTTGEFPHRVIKRAFWGTRQLKGAENTLNDYVDAIEVQNLKVKINYSNC